MERAEKSPRRASPGRSVPCPFGSLVFFEFNFDVAAVPAVASVARLPVPSATELAVVSSKAALASAGMEPGLVDATFVGNVIQSRFVRQQYLVPY